MAGAWVEGRRLLTCGFAERHRCLHDSRASDLLICGLELAFSATLAIAQCMFGVRVG